MKEPVAPARVGRATAHFAVMLALTACAVAAHPPNGDAATFRITTTADATPAPPSSLRAALEGANATAGGPHLIDARGISGTIDLQSALPSLGRDVQIRGPGPGSLTVRRGAPGRFRLLTVSSGITVEISDITLADGASPFDEQGGAIINRGTLTIRRAAIRDNDGGIRGGAISSTGTVALVASTVRDNSAELEGGGIYSEGTLTVVRSTIAGNEVGDFGGGGITNRGGSLTIREATISDNFGEGCGAIHSSGPLALINSTVARNRAEVTPGGLCVGGPATVNSSTIAANEVPASQMANILVYGGTAVFRSTLIAAPAGGGNCATTAGGTVSSNGYNLASDGSCALTAATDQVGIDPEVRVLAHNGGPTRTVALAAASPAIDRGNAGGLATDQRGMPRRSDFLAIPNAPGGDGSDVGAFEVQSNRFRFGRLARNARRGTAKLTVVIPGPGRLRLARTTALRAASMRVRRAGRVRIPIRPRGRLARTMSARAAAGLTTTEVTRARVTFVPPGGPPRTAARRVKVVRAGSGR